MVGASSLARLLRPRSIAVIGGGAWCASVVEQCRKIGFAGPIWPVHPSRATIAGLSAFPASQNLPEAPDAVFIGINRDALIEVLPTLNAMGAGGAVCFASGFLESGEDDLNQALLDAAGEMTLLGPNCYGFINYLDRCALWPDQHGGKPVESGVAIITQSSNIALNITMQQRGLPISYLVTVGNQAQTSLAEVGEELLNDERVTALGCHIEGFGDLAAFEALAQKAHALGKPVIILKAGRSHEARVASISHTASLTGDDAGADAFIKRLGFARVDTLPQFVDTLKLVHVHGRLSGTRIASLSCSGGEASLVADAAASLPVTFPKLTDIQIKRLSNYLGELVTLANPLDYHTDIWRDREALSAVFAAMSGPEFDLTMLLLDFPRDDICDNNDWDIVVAAIEDAASRTGRPFAVVASLPENMPESCSKRLIDSNIVPLCSIDDALAAVTCAANVLAKPSSQPVLQAIFPANEKLLSEYHAKQELAEFGLQIPENAHATSVNEIAELAQKIGFPMVLKGGGIAHKSEAGAVILGLATANDAVAAAEIMPTDSFLIERSISGAVAELLIGITMDGAHGYLLTIAAGGVLTELLKDRQTLLLPASQEEIDTALDGLNCSPLFAGYRGKPSANRPSIIKAVLAVQDYVIANAGKILEVEINPLMCTPDDAIAADVLIMKEA